MTASGDAPSLAAAGSADIVERLRSEGKDAMSKHYSLGMWKLCAEAADEIDRLRKIADAAANVANTLHGGFIRCERCGEQEDLTDIDFARDLYDALAVRHAAAAEPPGGEGVNTK